jgi:hypothetical protein
MVSASLLLFCLQSWLEFIGATVNLGTALATSTGSTSPSFSGMEAIAAMAQNSAPLIARMLYVMEVTRMRPDWGDWSLDNQIISPEVGVCFLHRYGVRW